MEFVRDIRRLPRKMLRRWGLDVVAYPERTFPADFSEADIRAFEEVRDYTMTSPERVLALIEAVRYISRSGVPGTMVECGVWRGGSMMAVARTLLELGNSDRELFLFDTFEGMPRPGERDVNCYGESGLATFTVLAHGENGSAYCRAALRDVQRNLAGTGYSSRHIHYVKGRVETTIPECAPSEIALLRLDTDWYESTLHELVHLFPRVSRRGIIIIDDYGHWQGARQATDEYLSTLDSPIFLSRIDCTGRLILKT